jgi:hypothetical protein
MYETPDVWYKAVVPGSGRLTIEIDEDIPDRTVSLYSSYNCGSIGNELTCGWFDDDHIMVKYELERSPGETIYIRLSYDSGIPSPYFRICAYEPTGYNDGPCIPISLNIPTKIKADILYNTSTSAGVPEPPCGGYEGFDVWFKTTVPANGSMIIEGQLYPGSLFYDGAMAVYKGSCGSLTLVECDDDDGEGYMPKIVFTNRHDLAGEDIYIRFWHYGNVSTGAFYFKLSENVGDDPIFKSTEGKDKVSKVNDVITDNLFMYPNPANDMLNIEIAGDMSVTVQLYNTMGQEVKTQVLYSTDILDISELKEGVYVVKFILESESGIEMISKKLVISR